MRATVDFGDFLEDYIGVGFVIGIILVLLVGIGGTGSYDGSKIKPAEEKKLYLALEGKAVDGTQAKEAAKIIRAIVEKNKTLPEYLGSLEKLQKSSSHHFVTFLQKKDKIIGLLKGDVKNLSASVEVPTWATFWKYYLILSWLGLALACTINFLRESLSNGESLLQWPWRAPWVYPAIVFMSPVLIPCMAVEAGIRAPKKLYRLIVRRTSGEQPRLSGDGHEDRKRLDENELNRKKLMAAEQIKNAASRIDEAKKAWAENRLPLFQQKTESFKQRVASCKEELSSLGRGITSTQRGLAEAEKELAAWEQNLEKNKDKAYADYLKELDQLLNLPYVKAVEIVGRYLFVYTDMIYIKYHGRTYEIGVFKITIWLDIRNFSVENLCTTHPLGKHHPYGGDPRSYFCWGSLAGPIYKALEEKEYAVAVHYIIQALQSAQGDNPEGAKEWKEVSK